MVAAALNKATTTVTTDMMDTTGMKATDTTGTTTIRDTTTRPITQKAAMRRALAATLRLLRRLLAALAAGAGVEAREGAAVAVGA